MKMVIKAEGQKRGYSNEPAKTPKPSSSPPPQKPATPQPAPTTPKK